MNDDFILDPKTDTVDGCKIWYRDLVGICLVILGAATALLSFFSPLLLERKIKSDLLQFLILMIGLMLGGLIFACGSSLCEETYLAMNNVHLSNCRRKCFYIKILKIGNEYNLKDVERPMP